MFCNRTYAGHEKLWEIKTEPVECEGYEILYHNWLVHASKREHEKLLNNR